MMRMIKRRAQVDCRNPMYKIRHKCYTDRKVFGQSKLILSQRDIIWILNEQQLSPDNDICIVPVNPLLPISIQNAMCVDTKQKTFLMALWRMSKNEACYTDAVKNYLKK